MKKLLFLITLIFAFKISNAQEVSCPELMKYVKSKGFLKDFVVPAVTAHNSSWLIRITAYNIENTIAVIAKMKTNDYGGSKEYVYCGIPQNNWFNFTSIMTSSDNSYGKRFHKYINPYKCDCY